MWCVVIWLQGVDLDTLLGKNHGICDMRNVRAPRQHSLRGCGEQLLGTARAKEGPTEGSGCKSLPSPTASVPCSQDMFSERGITLRASGCLKSLFSGEKCQEIMVKNKNRAESLASSGSRAVQRCLLSPGCGISQASTSPCSEKQSNPLGKREQVRSGASAALSSLWLLLLSLLNQELLPPSAGSLPGP